METIKKGKFYSIKRFDKEDYFKNFDEINGYMTRIFSSHETNNDEFDYDEALENINEKNADFFAEEFLTPRLYVLFDEENKKPISFALYSHDDERNDWHLEFVATHSEHSGEGYGQAIIKASAQDLVKTEFPRITSVVAKTNKHSLQLHEVIGRLNGVGYYFEPIEGERFSFEFDLQNMNKTQAKNDVDEIVF